MNQAIEILIPISAFLTIFGVIYVYLTTRNKERLSMIERGVNADSFTFRWSRFSLKIGLLAMGIALGILIGQALSKVGMQEEPATISMIFLFGGGGLVAEYFLAKKDKK